MLETQTPTDRIAYTGDLALLIKRVTNAYELGEVASHKVVEIGYEDCNVIITTNKGKFLAKMFAKTRKPEEIVRYTNIMQRVVEAGIRHPELMTANGAVVYEDSDVSLVVMRFIEGETFLELDRTPNDDERRAILEQAVKINALDYEPPYLFDSWAIPNIVEMFERIKGFVNAEDLALLERVIARYEVIPVADLPHAFVHGDFTKTNVLKSSDGNIYILDFSVANYYPRIQELAVIVANLLHDNRTSLQERCRLVINEYDLLSDLTEAERKYLPDYALAGVAMEFMGACQEKYINGNGTDETEYWLTLGRNGLRQALL